MITSTYELLHILLHSYNLRACLLCLLLCQECGLPFKAGN